MERVYGFERTVNLGSQNNFEIVSIKFMLIPDECFFSKVYNKDLISYLRKERGNFDLSYLDSFIIDVSFKGYCVEDINDVFECDPILADLDYFSDKTKLSIRSLTIETINRNKYLLSDFEIPDGYLLFIDSNGDVYIDQYIEETVNLNDLLFVNFHRDNETNLMLIETYRYKNGKDY